MRKAGGKPGDRRNVSWFPGRNHMRDKAPAGHLTSLVSASSTIGRSGSGLVGQTIAFCRLSTPGRFLCPTDHKKRWSVLPWTAAAYLSQTEDPLRQNWKTFRLSPGFPGFRKTLYSSRNACDGWITAARTAGNNVAQTATPIRQAAAPAIDVASHGVTP